MSNRSISEESDGTPGKLRGATFPTSTPFYAIESLVERLLEPGRERGRHYPKKLVEARAAFLRDSSGRTLGRWLTLDPSLLLKPCGCADRIQAEFFVQLGQHREELLLAHTTAQRRTERDWLSVALFGGSKIPTRPFGPDLAFDTFYAQEAGAWFNLLRLRPGLLHPIRTSRECESLRCADQRCVRAFIVLHVMGVETGPRASLRTASRAMLTDT